jgi:glutamate---cysteine ligase / carboxylate-amine ligase
VTTIDLDRLRAAFAADRATIGVEEEVVVVDRRSGAPRWDAPAIVARLADPRFATELPAAQLEHRSTACGDVAAVASQLRSARRRLLEVAPERAFIAAGVHPSAAAVLEVPEDPSYAATLAAHPWAARQQLVSALQVHVAIGPADVALAVHDALRSHLPVLTALAASAPIHAGEDTGLATVRPLIGSLLPRQGIPPALGSWDRYIDLLRWMDAAGAAGERRLWWDVRLRPAFGTLEIRAMDAQPTVASATALIALATSLVTWLADRARDGEPLPVHATERIAENRWRALHRGTDATLLDLDTGAAAPLDAVVGHLLDAVGPTADRLAAGSALEGLGDLLRAGAAHRIRAAHAAGGPQEATRWLVEVFPS